MVSKNSEIQSNAIQYTEAGIKMTKILCMPIRMKPGYYICYFPDNHVHIIRLSFQCVSKPFSVNVETSGSLAAEEK